MIHKIDAVFKKMAETIELNRAQLLTQNELDVADYSGDDQSLYDRLIINDKKIDGMIQSLQDVIEQEIPAYRTLYTFEHDNGMKVENKTVPFGTILIIYESRPDVTVEAAAIALKSGNRILLKGGKEARRSNLLLHQCWETALMSEGLEAETVRYLDMNRTAMQEFLKAPDTPIDLIIPRGGERLIAYVKSIARCPVLVSGRGNNFLYVAKQADLEMALSIIVKSKITKISACNALDKVLIHQDVSADFETILKEALTNAGVEVLTSATEEIWEEEFLAMKIVVARVEGLDEAIGMINRYSGQHSASIITADEAEAASFMESVDCAAVYHNASTRFTDGGQFGLGAEMAISTEKLHHRGPLGLDQLVTNKWFVYGDGQVR